MSSAKFKKGIVVPLGTNFIPILEFLDAHSFWTVLVFHYNNKDVRNKGSPWRMSREGVKGNLGVLLTKTENEPFLILDMV